MEPRQGGRAGPPQRRGGTETTERGKNGYNPPRGGGEKSKEGPVGRRRKGPEGGEGGGCRGRGTNKARAGNNLRDSQRTEVQPNNGGRWQPRGHN
ncbi:hypothetical protein SLA2020_382660 [Shorea laevis]